MMTQKPLGRDTGIRVAPISLGTVKIGRNTDVKYPGAFSLPTDTEVVALLEEARELGVTLIDTAPAYGSSEERLGRLLPGHREDWVICTKTGETYDGRSSFDFSAAATEASITSSLKRLGTEYLDIVLVHSDGQDEDIIQRGEVTEALMKLKDKGDIRAIGMSPKTPAGVAAALPYFDVLMITLNSTDQSHLDVIQDAASQGKGILIKKALASGHGNADDNLRFVLSVPAVDSVVVGTVNPVHLRHNVHVAEQVRP